MEPTVNRPQGRGSRFLVWIAVAVVLTGVVVAGLLLFRRDTPTLNVPDPELAQAIDLATDYLVRHCEDDGRFVYLTNLDPILEGGFEYNIVRHAGAIYALAMSQERRPTEPTRQAMLRAVEYLRRETIADVSGQDGLLAVWSRPEITGEQQRTKSKLGGTGLGLVGMLAVERLEPGAVPLETLQALGRFLVFMQEPDGSFYDHYDPLYEYRFDHAVSLYYPGEAALGLVMLYERDPQPIWLETAAKTIGYLARIREGKDRVEPDHWALLATAKLLDHLDELDNPPVSRETAIAHARQICYSMLAARHVYPAGALEHGCFTADARTCPTATRVEGLLAALTFLPADEEPTSGAGEGTSGAPAKSGGQITASRREIRQAAADGIAFLMRAQVRQGRYAGGIPRYIRPLPEDHPSYRPASRLAMTEIRIDYVQHALSGMIQFERLLKNKEE
ncbi:MAG: hypothetical protein JW818_02975 [Pirellulales bacterium]|nr:hypothetical protein [Pirellulales bacterium]